MGSSIASRWRELSGENNWAGLLQPLDPDLRRYIIHYSQRTAAVGDLFNRNTDEPDASKEEFFSKACLVKGNPYEYDVTHFLYAGSDDVEPSWFGYVAVATDEGKRALGRRDILVSWRGTSSISEWLNDFNFIIQISASDLFPHAGEHGATVHRGFHCLYTGTRPDSTHCKTSVREQVLGAVKELVDKYKDEEVSITVTGFSLGAALATLTAMDIVANGCNKSFMVTAFTYGGPRIGNSGLACLFDTLGDQLHLLRMKNQRDFVPTLPPGIFSYTEFGKKLIVNTYESKYLKWKGPFGRYAAFPYKDEDGDEDEDEDVYVNVLKRKRTRRDTCPLSEDENEPEPKRKRVRGGIPEYYSCHNMDVYGHGVAIKDIENNTPIDKLDHDLPLVNKHLDRIKNEYEIPPNWWTGENRKKMVQLENGRWVVKS
ncbi:DAD1-like seeding establishment-related lipase [Hibiscus trionum]|uniref:Phospholipase A1 n=1 Tax=Hibiscus trionum TaxID=183268 RepID=A0A9W7HBX9_HIBTR|nr:DAD1-like seeding establishment-related lipase [Hibiscus trionum]